MKLPFFIAAASDPSLIPGIYDRCDQWCMYCPATSRCLAYRCNSRRGEGSDLYRSLADRLYEGLLFLKQLSAAEDRPVPELEAMLATDPRRATELVPVNDSIERMGQRYGRLSDAYLRTRHDFPFEMKHRSSGPSAFEVFAWYHWLIPAKLYRALVAASQVARGDQTRHDEMLASAKIALIGIDRSLDALTSLAAQDDDPRLDQLQAHLRRLRREVEERFQSARTFMRRGLDDCDVAA